MKTAVELAPRMEALIREMADRRRRQKNSGPYMEATDLGDEARAIIAELPEPVDPDYEEAATIYGRVGEGRWYPGYHEAILAAIKRGRELASQS